MAPFGLSLPYLALYLRENANLDGAQIGAVFAVMPAVGILTQPIWGVLADRSGLRARTLVAISLGMGMIPLVAPDFKMWLPHAIEPLIDSGILLAAIASVVLNMVFNGAGGSVEDLREAAMAGGDH